MIKKINNIFIHFPGLHALIILCLILLYQMFSTSYFPVCIFILRLIKMDCNFRSHFASSCVANLLLKSWVSLWRSPFDKIQIRETAWLFSIVFFFRTEIIQLNIRPQTLFVFLWLVIPSGSTKRNIVPCQRNRNAHRFALRWSYLYIYIYIKQLTHIWPWITSHGAWPQSDHIISNIIG